MNVIPPNDHLVRQLNEAGLRVTPQRLAILSALASSDAHPTAQALYERLQPGMPSLSRATVYNTLQALVACGLIQEVGEAGNGGLRYDGNPAPHINLLCTGCQTVIDVFDIPLDDITAAVTARTGFKTFGLRFVYHGLCPSCQ